MEAVFHAVLGKPPRQLSSCRDDELDLLLRAEGVEANVIVEMTRSKKIQRLKPRRTAVLRRAAFSVGVAGAANMTTLELIVALRAKQVLQEGDGAERVASQESDFRKILGDPPKLIAKCSGEELAALAKAVGLDEATYATMSRQSIIILIKARREAALRAAAVSAGIKGAEDMTSAQLAAVLQAHDLWVFGIQTIGSPTPMATGATISK